MQDTLQIISSASINRSKWDACVAENEHGLIYARTTFLDYMSDNWVGIVQGDYAGVLPICLKKKWGITYASMPFFAQQMGWIGSKPPNVKDLKKNILSIVKYGNISFNFSNGFMQELGAVSRMNLILPLQVSYEVLFNNYTSHLKRHLRKSASAHLRVEDIDPKDVISQYRIFLNNKGIPIPESYWQKFTAMCNLESFACSVMAKKVVNAQGELLATALFLRDSKRIYNLMPTTLPEGRKSSAMHFLLDSIIREYAARSLLFDFEGSSISSVYQFYKNFAPLPQEYYVYRFNELPFPLNLLQ